MLALHCYARGNWYSIHYTILYATHAYVNASAASVTPNTKPHTLLKVDNTSSSLVVHVLIRIGVCSTFQFEVCVSLHGFVMVLGYACMRHCNGLIHCRFH